ncbi:unnamed protein product, partial [Fusarium fujikuroi]
LVPGRIGHAIGSREGHPTATITAMPLACTCPGIADRMVAKVDMAIREHKRKTRKEEQKAQRAKAIKERRERAALTRSLARQEREETTKASGEKIRIRTRLASRFHAMSPSESSQAENLPWLEEHKQKRQINKFSGFKVIA